MTVNAVLSSDQLTATVLDEIKKLGFRFATQSGLTIAIADIKQPETKKEILELRKDPTAVNTGWFKRLFN